MFFKPEPRLLVYVITIQQYYKITPELQGVMYDGWHRANGASTSLVMLPHVENARHEMEVFLAHSISCFIEECREKPPAQEDVDKARLYIKGFLRAHESSNPSA